MGQSVLLVHARSEESRAGELAGPLRAAGYDVIYEGTMLVGTSVVDEVSAALASNVPVVVCGTIAAIGTGWARRVVQAARSAGVSVFVLQMDEDADVEGLSFGEKFARYWTDRGRAIRELIAALNAQHPVSPARASNSTASAGLSDGALLAGYLNALLSRIRPLRPGRIRVEKFKVALELLLNDVYVELQAVRERPDVDRRVTLEELAEAQQAIENFDWQDERDREQQRRLYAQLDRSSRELDGPVGAPEDLGMIVDRHRQVVILGDPGSGKTTLLQHLALEAAQAILTAGGQDGPWSARVPLCLRVSEYAEYRAGSGHDVTVGDYLVRYVTALQVRVPEQVSALLRRLLDEGRCLVLLDGLDEVIDDTDRVSVASAIAQFAAAFQDKNMSPGAPGNAFVVTSRIAGYRAFINMPASFSEYTIRPMRREQIEQFLDRWCQAVERQLKDGLDIEQIDEAARREQQLILDAITRSRGVRRLAENPLLLRILAMLHRSEGHLPQRRVELYWEAADMLLYDWNLQRGLDKSAAIDKTLALKLLGPVAMEIHTRWPSGFMSLGKTEELLCGIRGPQRGDPPGLPSIETVREIQQFLKTVREHSGLFVERGNGLFGFMHQTFQEYFVARHLLSFRDKTRDEITARLHQPRWREPILLAVSAVNDPYYEDIDEYLTAILTAGSEHEEILHRDLLFAAECIGDCVGVPELLRRDVARRLMTVYCDGHGAGRYAPLRRQIRDALSRLNESADSWAVQAALGDVLRRCEDDEAIALALELVELLQAGTAPVEGALREVPGRHLRPGVRRTLQRVQARIQASADVAGPRQPRSSWDSFNDDSVLARALGALWLFGWRDLIELGLGIPTELLRDTSDGDVGAGVWLAITALRQLAWRLEACDKGAGPSPATVAVELDAICGILQDEAAAGNDETLAWGARFLAVIRRWYVSEAGNRARSSQVLGYLLDTITAENPEDFDSEDPQESRWTAAELLSGLFALRRGRRFTRGQRLRFGDVARRMARLAGRDAFPAELVMLATARFGGTADDGHQEQLEGAIGYLAESLGPDLQAQLERWGRAVLRHAPLLDAVAPVIVEAIRQAVPLAGDAATWRAAADASGQAVIAAMTRVIQAGSDAAQYAEAAFLLARLGDPEDAQVLEGVRADLASEREERCRLALHALRDPAVWSYLAAGDETGSTLRECLAGLAAHQTEDISLVAVDRLFALGITPELLAWCWAAVRHGTRPVAMRVRRHLDSISALDGNTPFLAQLDNGLDDDVTRPVAESLLLRVQWVGTETYAQCLAGLSSADARTRQVAACYLAQDGMLADVPREVLREAIRAQLAAMVHPMPVSWAALRHDPAAVRLLRELWRHGWRDALALVWVDEPAQPYLVARYAGWRRNPGEQVIHWFLTQARFGHTLIPLVTEAAAELAALERARTAGPAVPVAGPHPDDFEQVQRHLLAGLKALADQAPSAEDPLLPLRTDAAVLVAALRGDRHPRPAARALWDLAEHEDDGMWFWAASRLAGVPSQLPALRQALAAALDGEASRRTLVLQLISTSQELAVAMRPVLADRLGRPGQSEHEILIAVGLLLSSWDPEIRAIDRPAIAARLRGTIPRLAPQLASAEDGLSIPALGKALLCAEPHVQALAGCLLLCEDLHAKLAPPLVEGALSSDDQLRWVSGAMLDRVCGSLPADGSTKAVGWLYRHWHDNFRGRMNVEGTGHIGSVLRGAMSFIQHESPYWLAEWLTAIERGDDAKRRAALTAMCLVFHASDEVVGWLCARFTHGDTAVREAVTASLGSLRLDSVAQRKNIAITDVLVAASRDPQPAVRKSATDALQFTDHESTAVSTALLERAADPHEAAETRGLALVCLGRFLCRIGHLPEGDASADPVIAAVTALFADPCPLVSRAAAAGLAAAVQARSDSMALLSASLPDPSAVLAAALTGAADADAWDEPIRPDFNHQARATKLAAWVYDRSAGERDRLVEQMLTELERAAADMEIAIDDDFVGDPPWARRRIITSVLAELSEQLTHRSFAPARPLSERVAMFARIARDPDSFSTRRFCLRILGNLQQFTAEVATAFFDAGRDIPAVYWELRALIRKFKTFGPGSFQRLAAELFEPGNDASAAAHAAILLGELGISRSEELGPSSRKEISAQLVRFLRNPLAERTIYEPVATKDGEYAGFRAVGRLYDPVYEALVRVVAGPDAPESSDGGASAAEPVWEQGDDPSEQLDEWIQRFEQQDELVFQPDQTATRSEEKSKHPTIRVFWREGQGDNYCISFCWARQWSRNISYHEDGGYLELTVQPLDRFLPPAGGLIVVSRGADLTGWSVEPGSVTETLLREPGTRLLHEMELTADRFVVAVPMTKFDGVSTAEQPDRADVILGAAGAALLAPEDLIVGEGNVLGESNDVHVSFPHWKDAIAKVSYVIEKDRLDLIVDPGESGIRLQEADVILTRGRQFPVLRDADVERLCRRRRSRGNVRFTVSLPWPGRAPEKVSYLLAGNCLHIVARPAGQQPWILDREDVRFGVSADRAE